MNKEEVKKILEDYSEEENFNYEAEANHNYIRDALNW